MASHSLKAHEKVRRAMQEMYEGVPESELLEGTLGHRARFAPSRHSLKTNRVRRGAAARVSRAR